MAQSKSVLNDSQMAWLVGQRLEEESLEDCRERHLGRGHMNRPMRIDTKYKGVCITRNSCRGYLPITKKTKIIQPVDVSEPLPLAFSALARFVPKCNGMDGGNEDAQTAEIPMDQG